MDQLTEMQNEHLRTSGNVSLVSMKKQELTKPAIEKTLFDMKNIEPKKLTFSSSSSSFESLVKHLSDREDKKEITNTKDSPKKSELKLKSSNSSVSTPSPGKKMLKSPEIKKTHEKTENSPSISLDYLSKKTKKPEAEKYSSYEDDFDENNSVKEDKSLTSSSSSSSN